jgi:hypothetical protein
MLMSRDETARATFTVTCRYCTRVIVGDVPRLDDAATRALRAHLATCYGNVKASAPLGDVLFHFTVSGGTPRASAEPKTD